LSVSDRKTDTAAVGMQLLLVALSIASVQSVGALYANEWVVRVPGGLDTAVQLASDLGYDFVRQVFHT